MWWVLFLDGSPLNLCLNKPSVTSLSVSFILSPFTLSSPSSPFCQQALDSVLTMLHDMHTNPSYCTKAKNTALKSPASSWNNVTHNLVCKLSEEHFCLTCPYMDLDRPVWEEWVCSWWIYMQNITGSPIVPRLLVKWEFDSIADLYTLFITFV